MVRRTSWGCAALLAVGALAMALAGLALYGRHAVLDPRGFADRAVGTLSQDEVRDEIAERIAVRAVEQHPELAARRPVLDAAATKLVEDGAVEPAFRAGALRLHAALFTDDRRVARLDLLGAGRELHADLAARSRPAAAVLGPGDPELLALGGGRLETGLRDAAPWGRRLAALWPLALVLAALALAAAVARAPTRRRGVRRAALAVAVAAGGLVAATSIGRALVLSSFDTSRGDTVVGTIWTAFLADLRLWSLAAGAVCLIVAAAAEPGPSGAWRRGLDRALAPPGAQGRVARALALLALAALLLAAPEIPLDLALVAAAGALVFTAAAEVMRLTAA